MKNTLQVSTNNEELVQVENNQVVTNSRNVAEHFEKEHKTVLRAIENLAAQNCATRFFFKTTYENRGKQYPMYLMNRDGFSLLVMGFTGKKAIEWKLKYIEAFNKMEEEIKSTALVLPDFTNPAEAARAWADQYEKTQKLLAENKVLKPKADYTDRILASNKTVTTTAIAKDYGMSAKGFNKMLHDMHVIYKASGQWFLYAKYQDKGYTHSKTFDFRGSNGEDNCKMHTEWTQKGRLFLYNFLKERDVLPLIEREDN